MQTACVMKKRQEHMEEDFRICLTTNITSQKFRNARDKAIADGVERNDGARQCKEPLPITKWMCIFGAKGTHCRGTNLPYEHICPHIGSDLSEIDFYAIVDGASPHEDFIPLVKTES